MSDGPFADLAVEADVPLPGGLNEVSLGSLVAFALAREGASGEWAINLLFTSDDVMQGMHRTYMGLDSPTDIMTFPFTGDDEYPRVAHDQGGDIVISVDTAQQNAADAGWETARELQFLVLHGILHLLSWDDATTVERGAMLSRQHDLLDQWLATKA